MGEFDEIIPEYIAESTDLLQTVESGLLQMEQGTVEDEAVHSVFRAIHSIKGGAGFVGLGKIERLAHKMEDLLNLLRNHDLEPSPAVTDALLAALDVLTSLFERVEESDVIDIEGPIQALDQALHAGASEEIRQNLSPATPAVQDNGLPAFDVSSYSLGNKLKQGNVFLIQMDMRAVEQRGLTPIQLVNEMLAMGELLDAKVRLPAADDLDAEGVPVFFDVLYATVLESDLLQAALRLEESDLRLLKEEDFNLESGQAAPAQVEPAPATAPPPEPQPQAAPTPPPAAAPAASSPAPPAVPEPEPEPEPEEVRLGGEYLTFSLGQEQYGVDILMVQEIIAMPGVSRLPRSPEHVLGVMNLRGMVVPVIDLRIKLGLLMDANHEPVVVVLKVGDKTMGAVVDGVDDVVEVKEEEVQPPPEFAGHLNKGYLRGLVNREPDMIILLEMDRVVGASEEDRAA